MANLNFLISFPYRFPAMILLAGVLLVCPFGYSEDEPNDIPEQANSVIVGTTDSGSINPAGDSDFFKFYSQSNRYYRIETFDLEPLTQGGNPCDTVIVLYDDDGETILAEDDQSGSETNASKILWPSYEPNWLYLEIYHFYTSGTGKYKFVIEEMELPADDHGNQADETATELIPDNPATEGNTEIPGDMDFFRFSLETDLFYDLETSDLAGESDTLLALFSPSAELMTEDDQGGRESNASRIIFQASEAQTFYGRVRQFSSGGTGEYKIALREEGPAIPMIPDGTKVGGILFEAGDIDVYQFDAVAHHLYNVDLITGNFLNRFKVWVLDSDGLSVLAQNDFSISFMTWQVPASETYFLLVREDVQGGQYDLSLLDQGLPLPDADFNEDYIVDHEDLYLFYSQWQSVYPTPTP